MGILGVIKKGGLIPYLHDKKVKKASKKAVAAIEEAAAKNTALAQNIYDNTRNDFAPGRGLYGASIDALYGELGLTRPSGSGAPTPPLTGANGGLGAGGNPNAPPAANSPWTSAGVRADDTFIDSRTGLAPGQGGPAEPLDMRAARDAARSTTPSGAPPAAAPGGGPDWQTYLQQNPDVAAAGLDPAEHYEQYGKNEGRALPMNPVQMESGAVAEDPSANYGAGDAPGEYAAGDRPTYEREAGPVRPDQPEWQDPGDAPAFNFNFEEDPGYQWRLKEANRASNSAYGAKGLLKSGGALKGWQDRAEGLAGQSYNTAFDQYMQRLSGDRAQFNTDRAANFNIYDTNRNFGEDKFRFNTNLGEDRFRFDTKFDEDAYRDGRDFDYGQSRDRRGDWETDRSFGAGREDQRVSNIFGAATLGQNAVAGTATAGNVFTSAATAANNNVATARGNKALSDNADSFWNQVLPIAANAAGRAASGGF